MAKTVDVAAALIALDHPLRTQVDEVRALTFRVDSGISEQWKWNAPTFSLRDTYLYTFNLRRLDHLHLVVHHPAAPDVASDLLEGEYSDGRRMIYLRGDELESKRAELERVLRELVALTP